MSCWILALINTYFTIIIIIIITQINIPFVLSIKMIIINISRDILWHEITIIPVYTVIMEFPSTSWWVKTLSWISPIGMLPNVWNIMWSSDLLLQSHSAWCQHWALLGAEYVESSSVHRCMCWLAIKITHNVFRALITSSWGVGASPSCWNALIYIYFFFPCANS